jgi:hypothetical protein
LDFLGDGPKVVLYTFRLDRSTAGREGAPTEAGGKNLEKT